MFWGVTLDGGKRYSQTVDQPFHLSMAALESNPSVNEKSRHVQVMLQHDASEFLLCTLGHGNILQQQLDISFSQGEPVTFFLNGAGVVHLTGSVIEELDDGDFADDYSDGDVSDLGAPQLEGTVSDSDDEMDEDYVPIDTLTPGSKRKALDMLRQQGKKLKITELDGDEEDTSDEDYDSSFIDDETAVGDDDDEDEDDEEGSDEELELEEDVDDDDDDSLVEEIVQKSAKSPKSPKSPKSRKDTPSKKAAATPEPTPSPSKKKKKDKTPKAETKLQEAAVTNGAGDGAEATKKKKKKKKKKKNATEEQNEAEETEKSPASTKSTPSAPSKKRTVSGGVTLEDSKIGHGPEAKPGRSVQVYYAGILAKSNKRFDSCLKGKPFRFRLGKGEVIKGWDTGLIGMKVGGKRKITVPPSQGYGNSRQGPIPPGSTLVFEVELKAVE